MANRRGHLSRGKEAPVVDRTPAYALIAEQLRRSICGGSLPQGAVLLEGPLAALFGSSRSPVKQALSELESEGLLSRFEGRGLLVGRTETPQRVKITSAMLQMHAEPPAAAKSFAWQSLYYDFEREIILRS
ncbi:MAG: GntR family transcriptional regulator, partial [Xanthobacter sp. 17-67-6]